MLSLEFILFGVLMLVLGVATAYMFFTSTRESKVTRVGFLIVAIGFLMFSAGLFAESTETRAVVTFTIGSGFIISGLGYDSKLAKFIHVVLGLVLYGVMFYRYML